MLAQSLEEHYSYTNIPSVFKVNKKSTRRETMERVRGKKAPSIYFQVVGKLHANVTQVEINYSHVIELISC